MSGHGICRLRIPETTSAAIVTHNHARLVHDAFVRSSNDLLRQSHVSKLEYINTEKEFGEFLKIVFQKSINKVRRFIQRKKNRGITGRPENDQCLSGQLYRVQEVSG